MSWIRSNWIALAALVALIPATIGLTFSAQWLGYFATWPSEPTVVPVNQSATYDTADWSVLDATRVSADSQEGSDLGLPEGTDLVSVQVRVDPRGPSPYCTLELDELRDDTILRTWNATLEFTTAERSGCESDYAVTYSFETQFLVPSDAGADDLGLALNLSTTDELPRYLRLYF